MRGRSCLDVSRTDLVLSRLVKKADTCSTVRSSPIRILPFPDCVPVLPFGILGASGTGGSWRTDSIPDIYLLFPKFFVHIPAYNLYTRKRPQGRSPTNNAPPIPVQKRNERISNKTSQSVVAYRPVRVACSASNKYGSHSFYSKFFFGCF
jgi:hypothetical protein